VGNGAPPQEVWTVALITGPKGITLPSTPLLQVQQPFAIPALSSSMIFCCHKYGGPTGVVYGPPFAQATWALSMSVVDQRCGAVTAGSGVFPQLVLELLILVRI
jgi:hypothetical protein